MYPAEAGQKSKEITGLASHGLRIGMKELRAQLCFCWFEAYTQIQTISQTTTYNINEATHYLTGQWDGGVALPHYNPLLRKEKW